MTLRSRRARALALLSACLNILFDNVVADEPCAEPMNDDGILVLQECNFEPAIERFRENNEGLLVHFTAPWCAHCTRSMIEYRAAKDIAAEAHSSKKDRDDCNTYAAASARSSCRYMGHPASLLGWKNVT